MKFARGFVIKFTHSSLTETPERLYSIYMRLTSNKFICTRDSQYYDVCSYFLLSESSSQVSLPHENHLINTVVTSIWYVALDHIGSWENYSPSSRIKYKELVHI